MRCCNSGEAGALIFSQGTRSLRSVANSTRKDALDLLAEAPQVPVHTEDQVFPLEQANEALIALKQGHIRGAAVLQIR